MRQSMGHKELDTTEWLNTKNKDNSALVISTEDHLPPQRQECGATGSFCLPSSTSSCCLPGPLTFLVLLPLSDSHLPSSQVKVPPKIQSLEGTLQFLAPLTTVS